MKFVFVDDDIAFRDLKIDLPAFDNVDVKGVVAFAEDNLTGPKGPHLHSPEDCLSLGVRHPAKDPELRNDRTDGIEIGERGGLMHD
jgi:hypothetical protein